MQYEGAKQVVNFQQSFVKKIAAKYNGLDAGPEPGRYGYFMTFAICYIRDFCIDHQYMGESLETTCSWDNVHKLIGSVREAFVKCNQEYQNSKYFISFRVTQVYETGACVYMYFGFDLAKVKTVDAAFHAVYTSIRAAILSSGGSISHHHGVGKIRKKWVEQTQGPLYGDVLRGIKQQIDPKNIFAVNNIVDFM